MDSDTDLGQNVSIIIIMNFPPQNMLMTYKNDQKRVGPI